MKLPTEYNTRMEKLILETMIDRSEGKAAQAPKYETLLKLHESLFPAEYRAALARFNALKDK